METLECKAVLSRSRGADVPEPSDRECQRRSRGQMSMHQRDDQRCGNAELRSARIRQTPDKRDAQHRDDAASRSVRPRQTADVVMLIG